MLSASLYVAPATLSAAGRLGAVTLRMAATQLSPSASSKSDSDPRPYQEIPGPRGLPLIGTMLDHRDPFKMHRVVARRVREYGMLYKEKMGPGASEIVFASDPDDVETVFRASGKYPQRISFDAARYSREQLDRPFSLSIL